MDPLKNPCTGSSFDDFLKEEGIIMDRLAHILKLQRSINARCGVVVCDKNREAWLLRFAQALSQEVAELVETTNYRWWRDAKKFDSDHAKRETVDLLCFVLSIAQILNMDAAELYEAYLEKAEINKARQDAREGKYE